MNITIIGSGNMSKGISTRLVTGGHSLTILDRDIAKSEALVKELSVANVTSGDFKTPITGEIVIFTLPYTAVAEVIKTLGGQLADKIVVDISNPLNESYDGLVTPADSSAAEEIAKLLPTGAKLVKAFNTTFAGTLIAGKVAEQKLDVFVASDDVVAKQTVLDVISGSGLRSIDAGALVRARQLEAVGLLGITLQGTLGTNYMSAWKIIS